MTGFEVAVLRRYGMLSTFKSPTEVRVGCRLEVDHEDYSRRTKRQLFETSTLWLTTEGEEDDDEGGEGDT